MANPTPPPAGPAVATTNAPAAEQENKENTSETRLEPGAINGKDGLTRQSSTASNLESQSQRSVLSSNYPTVPDFLEALMGGQPSQSASKRPFEETTESFDFPKRSRVSSPVIPSITPLSAQATREAQAKALQKKVSDEELARRLQTHYNKEQSGTLSSDDEDSLIFDLTGDEPGPSGGFYHSKEDEELARRLQQQWDTEEQASAELQKRREQEAEDAAFARELYEEEQRVSSQTEPFAGDLDDDLQITSYTGGTAVALDDADTIASNSSPSSPVIGSSSTLPKLNPMSADSLLNMAYSRPNYASLPGPSTASPSKGKATPYPIFGRPTTPQKGKQPMPMPTQGPPTTPQKPTWPFQPPGIPTTPQKGAWSPTVPGAWPVPSGQPITAPPVTASGPAAALQVALQIAERQRQEDARHNQWLAQRNGTPLHGAHHNPHLPTTSGAKAGEDAQGSAGDRVAQWLAALNVPGGSSNVPMPMPVSKPGYESSIPSLHGKPGFQSNSPGYNAFLSADLISSPFQQRIVDDFYEAPISEKEAEERLRELLQNVEHTSEVTPKERRLPTPPQLKVELMEHQKLGLEWMLKMENGTNAGGILADDMGLGKTIQSIATILSNRGADPRPTLIIAPVSLLFQWQQELSEKAPNAVKILMYYGPRREKSPARIKDFDVVISSYSIIAREWPKSDKKNEDLDMDLARRMAGPVFKINWRRVILDEAHFIKNRGTGMAKACYQLDAKYRWCLTGTPLQNNIEELYSLVKFLRIQPFCDWTTFRTQIVQPFKMHNHNLAIGRVQGLMQAICLRRNKKSSLDGQPIILLPPKQMDIVREQFTDPEREFYKALETGIQIRFNKYVRAGTVLKNYTNILVLLLRLRQACCHPSLMGKDLEKMSPEQQLTESAREDRNEALFNALSPDVRRRLEESDLDQECAICMDAMTDAVLNMCGHIFCRECLTASVQHMATVSGAKPCPTCRANVELGDLLSVDFFKQKVNKDAPKDDISSIKGKGSAVMTLQGVEDEILEDLVAQAAHEHSLSSTKIDVLMRTLTKIREETPGEKVIVFSQFTGFLDIIERRLHTKDGRFKCSRYDGRMSATERDEALRQLRTDPQTNIILVSLKCGSLGLNLTCANHVILLDCWWNPAVENQAMDRVHRLGQLKQVTIHRVTIADTIEDRILELQAKKQELFDAAMNEGSGGNLQRQRLSVGDLMMLFNVNNNNNLVRQSSSEAIEIN